MLSQLFPKKQEPQQITPSNPLPQTLEIGKEYQSTDPKTGEFVTQRALTPAQRQMMIGAMQKNGQLAQQYVNAARQYQVWGKKFDELSGEITKSEKEIEGIVTQIRDEFKLDRRWGLNMALGVLERRDPPNG